MILENTGLQGLKSDLAHLDEVMHHLGFVRWQWEYYRATYDLKLEDKQAGEDYFVRVNMRVESGKLESAYAILYVEDIYIGKASFPHGLDYASPVPESVLSLATDKLSNLKQELSD